MKVFQMNDCDWWLAPSLDEAKADYIREMGASPEELEDAFELDDTALDRLNFTDDRALPDGELVKRPFREELERRIAAGDTGPGFFASTEW